MRVTTYGFIGKSKKIFQNCPQNPFFSGPLGCSKLTTSLVNVLLKFQTVISKMCQYFFDEKMGEAFAVQKLLSFFQQKISVYLVIKS